MAYQYRSDGLIVGDLNDDKTIDTADVGLIELCVYYSTCDMYGKRETQFDPLGG